MKEKVLNIFKNKKNVIWIGIILIVILVGLTTIYFTNSFSESKKNEQTKEKNNDNNKNNDQTDDANQDDKEVVKPKDIACDIELGPDSSTDIQACYDKEHDDNAVFTFTANDVELERTKVNVKLMVGFNSNVNNSIKLYIGDKLAYEDSNVPLYAESLDAFGVINDEVIALVIGKGTYVGAENVLVFDKNGNKIYQLSDNGTLYSGIYVDSVDGSGMILYSVYTDQDAINDGCADTSGRIILRDYAIQYLGDKKFGSPRLLKEYKSGDCRGLEEDID